MKDDSRVSFGESVVKQDGEVVTARKKTMSKLMWGPILGSFSRGLGMIGGPMFGTGLLVSLGMGSVAATPMVFAITIIGGAMCVFGIAIDYFQSRVIQDVSFDQVDVGAKSYAKSFIKELKDSGIVVNNGKSASGLGEDEAPTRSDGKTWLQVVQDKQEPSAERKI